MATLFDTRPRSFYVREARAAQRRILQIRAARPAWRRDGTTTDLRLILPA